jgi:FMN phosphatase YigB (HAD superfamily)
VAIRAVFFDVGETLVNEKRSWASWAHWLGVSDLTFFAVLGSIIERGEDHRQVFSAFRQDFNLERERASRKAAGLPDSFEIGDLYPDVRSCLRGLHEDGYKIGVAGNQPSGCEQLLRDWALPVDMAFSSSELKVEKPSPGFFFSLAKAAGCVPGEMAYVGDRLDNDVLPARRAGMLAVFLRRGPWGLIHARRPDAAKAHICIDSLDQLRGALEPFRVRSS